MTHPAEDNAQPQGTLWTLDLDQPLPVGPVLQVPVVFMRAGLEVAQELAQAMDLDNPAVVVQRFDNGRHCYIGRIEGTLVTYGWVTFDEECICELSLSIRLKAGEAYIWNCATLPEHRGQRLYPALLTHIVGELYHQGLHRVWIATDADNLPSQSGMVLAGLQPIGDVVISRVLTMRRAWMRGRPGVPKQLVIDVRYALFGEREEVWLAANSGELSVGTMDPHLGQPLVLAGESLGSARAAMIMLHGRTTAQDILTLTADLHWPGFIYLRRTPQEIPGTPTASLRPSLATNRTSSVGSHYISARSIGTGGHPCRAYNLLVFARSMSVARHILRTPGATVAS
jgi:hypothetical protein